MLDQSPVSRTYPTIIRKKNGEVIGKLMLADLNTIPSQWKVTYGSEFISKETDLSNLLIDKKFPLSIRTVPLRFVEVKSKTLHHKIVVSKDDTIGYLKQLINEKEGKNIDRECQQLFCLDRTDIELSNFLRFKGYMFEREGTLLLTWKRKAEKLSKLSSSKKRFKNYENGVRAVCWRKFSGSGGPAPRRTFSTVDVEANHVDGFGVSVQNDWEGYSYGLTIYGTCPSKSCPSHKIPLGQTSHRVGYKFLRIDLKSHRFPCSVPSCRKEFPIGNFVVCSGRALFRFRKSEQHESQSCMLESFGGIDNYATFSPDGQDANYKWIEA